MKTILHFVKTFRSCKRSLDVRTKPYKPCSHYRKAFLKVDNGFYLFLMEITFYNFC